MGKKSFSKPVSSPFKAAAILTGWHFLGWFACFLLLLLLTGEFFGVVSASLIIGGIVSIIFYPSTLIVLGYLGTPKTLAWWSKAFAFFLPIVLIVFFCLRFIQMPL